MKPSIPLVYETKREKYDNIKFVTDDIVRKIFLLPVWKPIMIALKYDKNKTDKTVRLL